LYADLVKKKMARTSLMATLQELDMNKDGKVSFNEFVNWAIKHCTQFSEAKPPPARSPSRMGLPAVDVSEAQ
ncbi:hypothetical protein HDU81_000753, partial [Chytriomyces hyalinus]